MGYAQTAAVGSVLMIGSTVFFGLSGRSGRPSFDRKVCLFVGCSLALRCQIAVLPGFWALWLHWAFVGPLSAFWERGKTTIWRYGGKGAALWGLGKTAIWRYGGKGTAPLALR